MHMILYADVDACTKIINLPDSIHWEFIWDQFNENGDILHLKIGDEDYVLGDLDRWCSGRPELPVFEVISLYEDLLKEILNCLQSGADHLAIHLVDLENELVSTKYKAQWLQKGYISIDPDTGFW